MRREILGSILFFVAFFSGHGAQEEKNGDRVHERTQYLQNLAKILQRQAEELSEVKLEENEAIVRQHTKAHALKRLRTADANKAWNSLKLQNFAVQPGQKEPASSNDMETLTSSHLNDLQSKLDAFVLKAAAEANALVQDVNDKEKSATSTTEDARERLNVLIANYAKDLKAEADELMQSARDNAGSLRDYVGSRLSGDGSDVREVTKQITDWFGDVQSSVSSFVSDAQSEAGSFSLGLNDALLRAGSNGKVWSSQAHSDVHDWLSDAKEDASRFDASLGSDAIDSLASKLSALISDEFSSASDLEDAIQSATSELKDRLDDSKKDDPVVPNKDFVPQLSSAVSLRIGWRWASLACAIAIGMWTVM